MNFLYGDKNSESERGTLLEILHAAYIYFTVS